MIKKTKLISLLMAIALLLSQVSVFAAGTDYALEISGDGVVSELKLSIGELKDLPSEAQIDEDYLYNSKSGEKTAQVKGVSLNYLLKEAGVTADNAEVLFEALDGYGVDPQSLQDIFNEDLKYVIAYEVNGEEVFFEDDGSQSLYIYRKQKEDGEFGTVYKFIFKIIVGEAIEVVEDVEIPIENEEEVEAEKTGEIVFSDITEDYKFAETAIYELAKKGIIDGIGNGLYAPQNEFNRAQFCKIIVEGLNLETKEYAGGFTDVAVDSWYAPWVQAAVESGLFQGYTDETFQPEKTINRQEMASVAARAAVYSEIVTQEKLNKFTMDKSDYLDKADVPEWAANAVAWLEAQGVFSDIAAENFEPENVVNRAEAAVVVFNTLFQD